MDNLIITRVYEAKSFFHAVFHSLIEFIALAIFITVIRLIVVGIVFRLARTCLRPQRYCIRMYKRSFGKSIQ